MDLQYYISSEEASFFINNKMGSSDRIPTSGTYKVGDFIISNTQEDGIFGWVCTVAGTPGTWIEIGSGGGNNTKILSLSSTTTISSPTNEVNIGISSFNKNMDTLMVYKNSTFMIEGVDYEINPTGSKIISKNGNWNEANISDYRFAFIVLKSVEVSEDENIGSSIGPEILDKINTIGSVNQLQTENKTNLVNAINEVNEDVNQLTGFIGDLGVLQTINKSNIVNAINELFQNANNGKELIAAAIGLPLTSTDTFSAMGTKIDIIKNTLINNLNNKGVVTDDEDSINDLVDKVSTIQFVNVPQWIQEGKKWINVDIINTSSYSSPSVGMIGSKLIYGIGIGGSEWSPYTNFYYHDINNNDIKFISSLSTQSGTLLGGISSINNTNFYFSGGLFTNSRSNGHHYYDLTGNTWTSKSNMLVSIYRNNMVNNNTTIYSIGGNATDTTISSTSGSIYCMSYDTLTNTWSHKTHMPVNRCSSGSCVYDNKIYVFGGFSGSGTGQLNTVMYDINTNTWTTKGTQLPTRMVRVMSDVTKDNKIRLVGFSSETASSSILNYIYDPEDDSYSVEVGLSDRHYEGLIGIYNDNVMLKTTSGTELYIP